MLINYLKIYYRHLSQNKLYSFINILGLGIGLSSFIIISLFVNNELSYDQFNVNKDNVYRVSLNYNYNGQWQNIAMTPPAYGPTLKEEFQEVEDYARFMPFNEVIVSNGNKKYSETILFADGGVFRMFSFPLLMGDPENILKEKFTAVISETTSRKYFRDKNPVGQIININDNVDLVVQGVFKDIPETSHLSFNILISMSTVATEEVYGTGALENYTSANFHNYLLLNPHTNIAELENKLAEFVVKYAGEENFTKMKPYLEPFSSIYLHSDAIYGTGVAGNIMYVYIFSAIALFILLIATINFINLTTSQSMRRAKEIGIRKVTGGSKRNLIQQFLGESIFLTILGFLLSLVLVEIFLPVYNSLAENILQIKYLADIKLLLFLFTTAVIVGLLSGIYPAFYLSSFKPTSVLKGEMVKGKKGGTFRKGLVIIQFAISVILIISTLVVNEQLSFMRNKDIGFQKENILYLQLKTPELQSQVEAIKSQLKMNSNVVSVAAASRLLGNVYGGWKITAEGEEEYSITAIYADEDYIPTMGLEILEGRNMSKEMPSDKESAILLNESAVRKFGWKNVIGKAVELQRVKNGNVIGVMKNFNYRSLHQTTEPLLITYSPGDYMKKYLTIRISGNEVKNTVDFVNATIKSFDPGQDFDIKFLDTFLESLYNREEKVNNIIIFFSSLAIILGCLGLFGMASFAAVRRKKEIGIRKVLGANTGSLVLKLSGDFIMLVGIANIIAWPIAYGLMKNWLLDFAYRIDIGIWVFAVSFIASIAVALLTVGYHALKSALSNPVDAIRYE